ncbi:hypothetical protein CLIB1423_06S03312 [[Candida] railenensis]|uniref:BRCT domain-containing protein n=1 Tax=[Candida] railenensis TaxID=45579 RepID=A0A9P0QPH2_9ASCO|nr:hypothetical protein CLIB1423_06S03312 [[Candida] railenensis]
MWVIYYSDGNKFIKKVLLPSQSYQVGCSNGVLPVSTNFISLDNRLTVRKRLKFKIGRIPTSKCMEPDLHTPIQIELQAPGPVIINNLKSYSIDITSPSTNFIPEDAIPFNRDKFSVKVIDLPGVEFSFYWLPLNISYTSASQKQMHFKKKLLLQNNIDFRICNYDESSLTYMIVTENVPLTSPVSTKILWCLSRCIPIVKIDWLDHVISNGENIKNWYSNEVYLKKYCPGPSFEVNPERKKLLVGTLIISFAKDFWSSLLENMGATVFEVDLLKFCNPTDTENQMVDESLLLNEVHRLVHNHLSSCYFLQISASSLKHHSADFINSTNSIIQNISACFGTIPLSSKQIEISLLEVSLKEVLFSTINTTKE